MLFIGMVEDEMHVLIAVYYTIQICHIQVIWRHIFHFVLNRSLVLFFFVCEIKPVCHQTPACDVGRGVYFSFCLERII